MYIRRKYVSLDDYINETKNTMADLLLADKSETERIETLKKAFLHCSVKKADDKLAVESLKMLMMQMDDWHFLPHTTQSDDSVNKKELWVDSTINPGVTVADYKACVARAELATLLIAEIKQTVDLAWYLNRLVETRKSLLLLIAHGWKSVNEDCEAEKYFAALLSDPNLRLEIVRSTTDTTFPITRVLATIRKFRRVLENDRKLLETLVLCWLKGSTEETLLNICSVSEPLSAEVQIQSSLGTCERETSYEAYQFVRQAAEWVKPVDDAIQKMFAKVGRYDFRVEYPKQKLDGVANVILVRTQKDVSDTNAANQWYEAWRNSAQEWVKENPLENHKLRIYVKYVGEKWNEVVVLREDFIM